MIAWEKYQTLKFKPRLVGKHYDPVGSCGVYALAYLTGMSLQEIDKHTPKHPGSVRSWWDDDSMVRFLKKRGFTCIEINAENLHSRKGLPSTYVNDDGVLCANPSYYERHPNHLNVMLISQHTKADEGSWAVAYNHRYYHGEEVEFFTGYELIVNPFWTGYVIWHPKFKTSDEARRRALSLSFVGRTNFEEKIEMFNPLTTQWFNIKLTKDPQTLKLPR